MNCQMMRVISSPSSSTTVPSTLILLMFPLSSYGFCAAEHLTSRYPAAPGLPAPGPHPSEVGDVGLLGAHGLGGLAQPGQLAVGEVALDHATYALAGDLGLHAQVHPVDAVLAVHPRAHRHDLTGVLHHGLGHAGGGGRRRVVGRPG